MHLPLTISSDSNITEIPWSLSSQPILRHSATKPGNILLVMNMGNVRDSLQRSLELARYQVSTAETGEGLFTCFEANPIHLVLLNMNLRDSDSFALCAELRSYSYVPIVLLAEVKRPDDLIRGLHAGADSYLGLPISFHELDARLQAIIRRAGQNDYRDKMPKQTFMDIVVDSTKRCLYLHNKKVPLTITEYRLIQYLLNSAGKPVSKTELIKAVWNSEASQSVNFIEVAIRRLRRKLETDPSNPEYLITVYGVGYQLNAIAGDRMTR